MLTRREVQQLWRTATGFPWPRGWTVEWVNRDEDDEDTLHPRNWAETCYEDRIVFIDGDDPDPVATLVHEFVHVILPEVHHGETFRRVLNILRRRVGLSAVRRGDQKSG